MQVVVTDANTPQALAAIRELGRAGHSVAAIAPSEGVKRVPLGLTSKYAEKRITFPASLTESQYQDWLLDRLDGFRKTGAPILLPTGPRTLRLVAKRKIEFKLASDFLVPDPEALVLSWDKRLLARAAADYGLQTPEGVVVPEGENISKAAAGLQYPLVAKYWGGERIGLAPKRRYTVVHNANELSKRYNNMYDVQSPVLLQSLVPGASMGVSVVMDSNSRPVRVFIHERVRQYPVTGGPGSVVKSVWRGDLAAAAVGFFSAVGWKGLGNLEFKVHEGGYTLIDCNARLWSSFPLSAASGGRLAEHYVMACLDEALSAQLICRYKTGRLMQYFADDIRVAAQYGPGAFIDSLKLLINRDVTGGVRDRQDKKPTGAYVRSFFYKYPPYIF